MISAPAVVVHGLDDAGRALGPGRPVVLLSAPGAALFGGCGWWMALIAAARARFPATPCADLLDCGDAPGQAMAALRAGQKGLVLAPGPAFAAVAGAAGACGAIVLPSRPSSLDLGTRGAERLLRDWLQT